MSRSSRVWTCSSWWCALDPARAAVPSAACYRRVQRAKCPPRSRLSSPIAAGQEASSSLVGALLVNGSTKPVPNGNSSNNEIKITNHKAKRKDWGEVWLHSAQWMQRMCRVCRHAKCSQNSGGELHLPGTAPRRGGTGRVHMQVRSKGRGRGRHSYTEASVYNICATVVERMVNTSSFFFLGWEKWEYRRPSATTSTVVMVKCLFLSVPLLSQTTI